VVDTAADTVAVVTPHMGTPLGDTAPLLAPTDTLDNAPTPLLLAPMAMPVLSEDTATLAPPAAMQQFLVPTPQPLADLATAAAQEWPPVDPAEACAAAVVAVEVVAAPVARIAIAYLN
jgi:hypothetical protein